MTWLLPVLLMLWGTMPVLRPAAALAASPEQQTAPHPRLLRAEQEVYAIINRRRRYVTSAQVFADYRFREEWVEQVTLDELTAIPRGEDLVAGPVLRAPDGTVWIVYLGTRRHVAAPDAWGPLRLTPEDAMPATEAEISSYSEGRPVGNPPRPWMALVLLATLGAGGVAWWLQRPAVPARAAVASAGAILALAAILRAYYATLFPWMPDGADAGSYITMARYLAAGGSVMKDGPYDGMIGITSPLYPMVLALFGWVPALLGGSVVGWKLLQVGASLLLALVTGALARELFGSRTGRLAVVVSALSPVWLYVAETLQYEVWLALTIASGALCLLRAGRWGRRRFSWALLAGVLLGLAGFFQLKAAALWAPAALYVLWVFSRGEAPATIMRSPALSPARRSTWHRGAMTLGLALFLVPALLPLSGWVARNLAVHREVLLGSNAAGVIFWMGNHDGATGGIMQVPRPDAYYDQVRRYPEGSVTRETRAYSDLAVAWIEAHPTSFAVLAITKLERFWWSISPERLGEFAELRLLAFLGGTADHAAITLISRLFQYTSMALAAAGLLWGARLWPARGAERKRVAAGWLLVVGMLATFWLVHIPFISEPRYRVPVIPLIQVFEAAGLALLLDAVGGGAAHLGRSSEGATIPAQ